MNQVMVDIETLGTGRDAAILSIGAVRFDLIDGITSSTFHAKIDLAKSENIGKIDASTVEWWLHQEKEAQTALFEGERITLFMALTRFFGWLAEAKVEGLWSNGPTFDEMILRDAYTRLGWNGLEVMVNFRASRCMRTICDLGRTILGADLPKLAFMGTKHDALADAIHQAQVVSAIYHALRGKVMA